VFVLGCSSLSRGQTTVVFFDNFDDGGFDGWTAEQPVGIPANPPDIVDSPEGKALRGVGSGYSQAPGLNVFLAHPFSVTNVGEMKIEMRAKSGPQWPNQVQVYVVSGSDYYGVRDYGEQGENETADWYCTLGGEYRKHIGPQAFEWHNFAWTRDTDGWWSLSIDNVVVWDKFVQDTHLTSFDKIGIQLLRNQSEIEWVRISFVIEPIQVKTSSPEAPAAPTSEKAGGRAQLRNEQNDPKQDIDHRSKENLTKGAAPKYDAVVGTRIAVDNPEGLVYRDDGFWVLKAGKSHAEDRLQHYSVAGTLVNEFRVPGSINRTGLAWDGTHWWIADNNYGPEKIYKLDANLKVLQPYTWSYTGPVALEWAQGYLWVADNHTDTIYRVSVSATSLSAALWSTANPEPAGLAWDGRHMWSSCGPSGGGPGPRPREIYQHDALGNIIKTLRYPDGIATGIAFVGAQLYYCDYEKDQIIGGGLGGSP
ncbi:MAG: NHL repeat-containing protein, partial [Planctomycetota bacterium]